MEAFLKETFGNPDISITNGNDFDSRANESSGIYIMISNYPGWFGASGHTDFYNGSNTIGNSYFNPTGGGVFMLWKLN